MIPTPTLIARRYLAIALMATALATMSLSASAVDWRSLFHGETATPKSPPPEKRARVLRAEGLKADAQIEDFLNELADALMARDGKRLLPTLSPRYAITGLPASQNPRDVFVQAIERIPGPLDMEVRTVSTEQDGSRLTTVELRFPKGEAKIKRFRFEADGKLIASDLFIIRVEQHSL